MIELAGGSVLGRDHRRDEKNNQDSFRMNITENCSVAVVCDGCGESKHSEVGAELGAALTAEALIRNIRLYGHEAYLERVREDVLAHLRVLALAMDNSLSAVVSRNFLFTIVGMVATSNEATFFSLGDGVVIVNGRQYVIGPYPGNAPPYIAYGLVESDIDPGLLKFQVIETVKLDQLEHFLLGTDGVMSLIEAENQMIPGRVERVGPISQFWEDDRNFINPDFVRRKLKIVNRDLERINWEQGRIERLTGYLGDDTTLVVGKVAKE